MFLGDSTVHRFCCARNKLSASTTPPQPRAHASLSTLTRAQDAANCVGGWSASNEMTEVRALPPLSFRLRFAPLILRTASPSVLTGDGSGRLAPPTMKYLTGACTSFTAAADTMWTFLAQQRRSSRRRGVLICSSPLRSSADPCPCSSIFSLKTISSTAKRAPYLSTPRRTTRHSTFSL